MGTVLHKLRYLNETKADIKKSLESKGAKVTGEDTFRNYADYIADLSGGANAGSIGLKIPGAVGIAGSIEQI